MTAGRGFIALAAVIFGRWDPLRAGAACLLFAAAETLQIQLQAAQVIPSQFVAMIPYVLTIVAVAGVVGRSRPPAALGRDERVRGRMGKLVVLLVTAFVDMLGGAIVFPLIPFLAQKVIGHGPLWTALDSVGLGGVGVAVSCSSRCSRSRSS